MATTLTIPPRAHFLDLDDNWVTLETDIYTAAQVNRFRIFVDGDVYPQPGETLNLQWGDDTVALTFVLAPDNSGLQLPTRESGEFSNVYRDRLVEELRSVSELAQDMVIDTSGEYVNLTLISNEPLLLTSTTSGFLTVETENAASDNAFPNLSAVLHVYEVDQPAPLLRLRGSYDRQRRARFNLGRLFGLRTALPDPTRLRDVPPDERYRVERATEGVQHYYFRYADEYGRPPRAERLVRSADFVAVAGGTAGDGPGRWGRGGLAQLCHAYLTPGDRQFWKPVHEEQPDWLYWYTGDEPDLVGDLKLYVTLQFSSGQSTIWVVTPEDIQAEPRALYCFPTGFRQLGLHEVVVSAGQVIHSYEVEVRTGVVPRTAVTYRLYDDPTDWIVYLAYTNGVGGIETVAMRGKQEGSYRATRKRFRRAGTQVQDPSRGEFVPYDEEGQAQWRLRSGYYPREYVDHLRQLMLADVWICDPSRQQFIAVNVDQTSLQLTQDDDQLHAIEITVTLATPDRNAHRL